MLMYLTSMGSFCYLRKSINLAQSKPHRYDRSLVPRLNDGIGSCNKRTIRQPLESRIAGPTAVRLLAVGEEPQPVLPFALCHQILVGAAPAHNQEITTLRSNNFLLGYEIDDA